MYKEDNANTEIAETNQNLIRAQNRRAITKKMTLSMINNITTMGLSGVKKKEQLVELSNAENRVANFLKIKLEKNSTLNSDRNPPSHLPIMEETSLIFESDNEEFSHEEKKFPHSLAKKKTIAIRNPGNNTKSNKGLSFLGITDSPLNQIRNLSKLRTSKANGLSTNLNKMDELKEKYNKSNLFSFSKKLTVKPNIKWGNLNEPNLIKSGRKYKEENEIRQDDEDDNRLASKINHAAGLSIPRDGNERIKQRSLVERKRGVLDRKMTVIKPSLNERKWSSMDVRKVEKKMTLKERILSNIERKNSELKIEKKNSGDSESVEIEDNKLKNIEELQEEIKSNLKSTLIEDTIMEEIEMFDSLQQKEKTYRMLSHKELVFDSLSDEDRLEDIVTLNTINPDGNFLFFFNILIFIGAMNSIIFTPLYVAYYNASPKSFLNFFFVIEAMIEILFVSDVVLNFYVGYYDGEEKLIVAKNKIANNYLDTWLLTDILSALPFHTVLFTSIINEYNANHTAIHFKSNEFATLRILLLFRLFKILKVFLANKFTLYVSKSFFEELNATLYRVLQFLLYFSIMIHLLACIFIFLGMMNHPNWISSHNLQNSKSTDIYVASVYFIMATLFTIGYGDINSTNNSERIYNIFILMFGVLIYSYALSSLANFFLEKNNKEKLFEENKQCLETINNKYMLKPELYTKIEKFLKFKLHTNKREETDFLNELPTSLKNEMILRIYKPIIKDFVFFRYLANATKEFTVKIVMSLKPVTAVKNDRLVKEGEYIEEMIFIKNGILSLEVGIKMVLKKHLNKLLLDLPEGVIETDESKDASSSVTHQSQRDYLTDNFNHTTSEKKSYKTLYLKLIQLRDNEHFGDILMFLNERSPLSVKVKSKTAHLFTMNKTEMVSISMNFPQIFEKICKRSAYNHKNLEILINKTKYLFYKKNKNQFISEDLKLGNNDNYTHYFINTLDEEEIRDCMSSSPSVGDVNEAESKIGYEIDKNAQKQSITTDKHSLKSLNPINITSDNKDIYKNLCEKLNKRVIVNNEEAKTTENIESNSHNVNEVLSVSKNSSNSTISEKSKCEEDDKNKSADPDRIILNNSNNLTIQEENTYRSEETIVVEKNLNKFDYNRILFKDNFDNDPRRNLEITEPNNIIEANPTDNNLKSSLIFDDNLLSPTIQGNNRNKVKSYTIFSEFQSIRDNFNESIINEELNSDLSRDKARIRNYDIKQLVPFYSYFPENQFTSFKNNYTRFNQTNQHFPHFVNDESIKNTITATTANLNPTSPTLDPRQIQCNININNNINFNDNYHMQVFQSNCPNCCSTFFPISANRVLLMFPAEKYSHIKESLSWTNMKVSQSNSFELNTRPEINKHLSSSEVTINNKAWRTSMNEVNNSILDDDVKFKNPPIKRNSFQNITVLKPESTISQKAIKKPIIAKRKNSIDVLHQFKNNLFDPRKMKKKSSDKLIDNSAINNKNSSYGMESVSNINVNRKISEAKTTKNNMLSVVYKNIQENSLNLNEPKSFYSNLLMGVMDEKHKSLDMMKELIVRLKGVYHLISNNSKNEKFKLRILQDAG